MDKVIRRRSAEPGQCDFPPGLHPLLQRIYAGRGISAAADLERELSALLQPADLLGIGPATALLERAVREDLRVLIIGDYDADGATSTALAVSALRACGARNVGYLVPNRFEYGYGLTPEVVELAAAANPDVLVTVDNGISSIEGVAEANRRGMQVLVTDHHLPGETLPDAAAIVNPNQPGCGFAARSTAGVGVIFYVMAALRTRLRENDWFAETRIPEPRMAEFLDLVALGTVADVVPLERNNRILVWHGLRRIRAGQARPGVLALLEVAGRDPARCVASDLGFFAGPRLNAAGRIDDMSHGVECLLAETPAEARRLAEHLHTLNGERREIEAGMLVQAEQLVEALAGDLSGTDLPLAVSLYDPSWHQGVIGILASRIKERLFRPVIAFAPAAEGSAELKGSGRSIPGFHLRDSLARIDAAHPGLIRRFGGHAMAAGLTLEADRFETFRDLFAEDARQSMDDRVPRGEILSDGELGASDFSLEVAALLREAGPWGQAFPEPLFDGEFEVLDQRTVGERHLKLSVAAGAGAAPLDAIAFNPDLERWRDGASRARLAYRLDINRYRGRESVQLVVEHLEAL